MNMYYVYKKDYCEYSENRGVIVLSNDPNRAKGIGMLKMHCEEYPRKDIIVEEIDITTEGVVCKTDYIIKK